MWGFKTAVSSGARRILHRLGVVTYLLECSPPVSNVDAEEYACCEVKVNGSFRKKILSQCIFGRAATGPTGTMGRHPQGSATRSRESVPPPTQVFTRGRTGVVTTKRSDRRASSMEPTHYRHPPPAPQRGGTGKQRNQSRYSQKQQASQVRASAPSHASIGSASFGDSADNVSEDHSISSAPTPASLHRGRSVDSARRVASDGSVEGREPSSSRGTPAAKSSFAIHSNHSTGTPMNPTGRRELSPDRSMDIQKQHVRTTRKIVEGKPKE